MGDPSGVGAEVTLKALASHKVKGLADFFVIGDRFTAEKAAKKSGLDISNVSILDLSNVNPKNFSYGISRPEYGAASIAYIDKALDLFRNGLADALVTAPINKLSVSRVGFKHFEGHTEYLAGKTGTKDFSMVFVGGPLKISLVTRHIALRDVPIKIKPQAIYKNIRILHFCLTKYFRIKRPRIAVAGLNPHAGEGGMFGTEENSAIEPAVRKAENALGNVYGPLPPDIIFHDLLKKKFDAAVALYHDQALIPFKLLYFSNGVNLTAGLPFIRTSPDHGTAFDIAGKGVADPESMIEAIRLAVKLSLRR